MHQLRCIAHAAYVCCAVLCCAGVLRPLHTARTLPACLVHAFTGNEAELEAYRGMDFYIGVTGHLLRKKNPMVEWLAKWVPLSRLLIETDSPYMGAYSAPLMHNTIYPTACRLPARKPAALRYSCCSCSGREKAAL
jgi:Tat protein secretion system quality control protein TatD with DNase activity